jgi:putative ABC transport system substrate-binding protein
MRRRELITLLGGAAAAWPLVARAQGERKRRIGVLMFGDEADPDQQSRVRAFRGELVKMGWIEGRNIEIDSQFAATASDRIRSLATNFVAQSLDAILANGTPVLEALQKRTGTIPIVFVGVSDPLSAGFVPSLARPGGNITGFSNFEYAIGEKWLQFLDEAAPHVRRVAVLLHRDDAAWARYLAPIEALAPKLGKQLTGIFLGDPSETERRLETFARDGHGGVIVSNNARAMSQRELIGTLSVRHQLPAIYPARVYAVGGGLISYGIDPVDPYRHAAGYVNRILNGEHPGELPVQAPTKYELVINLRTAKALGLTIPPTLLVRADEIIE